MDRTCRFCQSPLTHTFVDLGLSPLSNAFVKPDQLNHSCLYHPLHTYVCDSCFLVQLEEFETPGDIFSDYPYFSSFSESWLKHAEAYTQLAVERFQLGQHSKVIEIACNDGYLLQFFVQKNIPVLGIEPAKNVAVEAQKKDIPVLTEFFGSSLAERLRNQGIQADLLVGNNVLAHVPDLNDFVKGLKILLGDHGVVTMEFPHLLKLINYNQFDTIYHEHFSYFSFHTVQKVFAKQGLTLFDVEELPTHGGSLRIYARHDLDGTKLISERVAEMEKLERNEGLDCLDPYQSYSERVKQIKRNVLQFIINQKNQGKTIIGYGAAAKGNTMLNYCGIDNSMIDYVVDRNPVKQGLALPGTHIPIYEPSYIQETKPDFVVILPWNLRDEIAGQLSFIREWGGQFVVWIPDVEVF